MGDERATSSNGKPDASRDAGNGAPDEKARAKLATDAQLTEVQAGGAEDVSPDTSAPNTQRPKRGRKRHAATRLTGGIFSLLAMLVVLLVGGVAVKLRSGPIDISRFAPVISAQLSAQLPNGSARIDGARLSMVDDRPGALNVALSGFTFLDDKGVALAQAPNVSGVFLISDLLRGQVEPSELVVSDVVVAVRRLESGKLVIDASSNGQGGGDIDGGALIALLSTQRVDVEPAIPADKAVDETQTDDATGVTPVQASPDAATASAAPVETGGSVLSLENVELIYADDITGREWRAADVAVTISNSPQGVRAVADIDVEGGRFGRQTLRVQGYRASSGALYLDGAFSNIAVADIASQITALEWLAPFEAPVEGRLKLALDRGGQVTTMDGSLRAGKGLFRIPGATGRGSVTAILTAGLDFEFEPLSERFIVSKLNVDAARGRFDGEGLIELERRADETLTGLVAQVTLRDVTAVAPELFAAPLAYDRADMTARLRLDPLRVEVGEIALSRGDLTLGGAGVIRRKGEAFSADLIVRGGGLTAEDLLAHWPNEAAGNARDWVAENILSGRIDDVNASIRIGGARDVVSLDFTFSEIDSLYLGDMPPVRSASGAGQLNLSAFHLNLIGGKVLVAPPASDVPPAAQTSADGDVIANQGEPSEPPALIGGSPLDLAGSSLSITGLDEPLEQMNVDLAVTGPAKAMLAIIDKPPLSLISKLGAPLDVSAGQGDVRAAITFPLLKDLLVEDIQVESEVTLTEIRGIVGPDAFVLTAPEIGIIASAERMTLKLDGALEGVALDATWQENFVNGARTISATGAVTPDVLARFGVQQPWFTDGSIRAGVTAATIAGGYRIDVDANATNAAFAIPSFTWGKAAGEPSRVQTTVTLAGGEIALGNLRATAGEYSVAGNARVTDDGAPVTLRFDQIKAPGLIDGALSLERVGNGWKGAMTGAYLNLPALRDHFAGDEGDEASNEAEDTSTNDVLATDTPVSASINIALVQLTDDIHIANAKGGISLGEETRGSLSGDIGGIAPVKLDVVPAGRDREVTLTSDDAGSLMRALGVFDDGSGGALEIKATLPSGDNRAADGLLRVYGLVIHDDAKLEGMLIGGELDELREKMRADGIHFKKIITPFVWRGDVLTVSKATARGSDIGVTIDGNYFLKEERLDMKGVFTPFYGVNSALSKVPLLGTVLTGGKGQGIFALNYSVTGPASDPKVNVNPLSILAPGILRQLLDGDGEGAAPVTADR